jgi:hypothetical protein
MLKMVKTLASTKTFTDFSQTIAVYMLIGSLSKSGKRINAHHHCPISVFILTASKLEDNLEIPRYGLCASCTRGGGGEGVEKGGER